MKSKIFKFIFVFCFFLFLFFFSSSAFATNYYVDAVSGNDSNDGTLIAPWKTITHSVTHMTDGDILNIENGIYDVSNGEVFPIEVGRRKQFKAVNTGLATIAATGASYIINGTDEITLDGLYIAGTGTTNYNISLWWFATIQNCTVTDTNGRGIRLVGSNGSIQNCTVNTNMGWGGPAIYLDGGNNTINNCSVTFSGAGSGAIALGTFDDLSTISNSTIIANNTDFAKYGISIPMYTSLNVINCTIEGNATGHQFDTNDRGITGSRATVNVASCEIKGFYAGIQLNWDDVFTVSHTTISDFYLGCYVAPEGSLNITDSIIVGDGRLNVVADSIGLSGNITSNYNCVSGNLLNYDVGVSAGANDINQNPRFVDFANRDFRLYSGSGCLSTASDTTNRGRWQGTGVGGDPYTNTKYVSTAGNDENNGNTVETAYRTITKATRFALDEIKVTPGTYNNVVPAETFPLYLNNSRKLVNNGDEWVTVEATDADYVLYGNYLCTIEGIYVSGTNTGAWHVYLQGSGKLLNSYITGTAGNNRALNAGADCLIQGCTFNTYTGYTINGIYINGSSTKINRCSINQTGPNAAAVYIANVTGIEITNSTIISNYGSDWFANQGIYRDTGSTGSTLLIANCTIEGKASGTGYVLDNSDIGIKLHGGGADVTITSCEVRGFYNGILSNTDSLVVNHNDLIKNYNGLNVEAGTTTITNSIISSNEGTGLNGTITSTYNDVWGNGTNYSGCSAGTGDISSNPLFTDYTNNILSLQGGSPCIDTGNPAQFDIDGTITDMGRYYYPQTITKLVFTTDSQILTVGQTSEVITVQTQSNINHAMNVSSAATIDLTSTSGGAKFLSYSDGETEINFVTISSGSSSANFYYRDTTTGTPTVTATENPSQGWIDATQQETINLGTVNYLRITSEGSTVVAGANKTIVLTAYDAYNNISTDYTGVKNLTFSGLSNSPNNTVPKVDTTNLGSATSITFSNGGASGVLVAYKTEAKTLEATDGTINTNGHALNLTVSSGAISSLTLEAIASQTSGTAFISTIEVLDVYGNRTTNGITGGVSLTTAPITTLSNIISPTTIAQADMNTGIWTGNLTITATGSGTSIVTAECSSKNVNKVFTLLDLTPPEAPTSLAITKEAAGGALYISWTNPAKASLSGYVIRYSNSSYPATKTDGTLVTEGTVTPSSTTRYKHTGLTNNTKYYYSIFAYDAAGNYSTGANVLGTPEGSSTTIATVEFRSSIQGTTLITGDAVDASQVVAVVREPATSGAGVSSLWVDGKAIYSDPTFYINDQVVASSDYILDITTEIKDGELRTYFTFKLKSGMADGTHSIKFTLKNNAGETLEGQVSGLKVRAGSAAVSAPLFYPNPANPDRDTMVFVYELSKNVGVEIYLFDPSGRQIYKKVCESGTQGGSAGYNEVSFNGKNDFGEVLGNGVYFAYIVEASSKKKIGKIKVAIYR